VFNKQNEKKTFCLYVLMSSLFVFLLLLLVFCCTFSIHFGLIISFLYLSCLLERNSTIQLMHTSITCNSVIFVVHTRSFSFIHSLILFFLLFFFFFSGISAFPAYLSHSIFSFFFFFLKYVRFHGMFILVLSFINFFTLFLSLSLLLCANALS